MKHRLLLLGLSLALGACAGQEQATSPTSVLLPLPSATPLPAITAPVATPVIIASPTFTPTPVTYVVQKGDTLIGIAVTYGVSVEALQAANNGVQPQFLSIGAVLVIPSEANPEGGPVISAGLLPTPIPIPLSAPACYPTPTGALYCFVEARNSLEVAVENVSARITLAGADGLPLADGMAYSALDVIPPGAAAPLAALFPSAPNGIAATGAELITANAPPVAANASPDPSADHILLDVPTHHGAASGAEWIVTGQVRNPSATPAASAWLVVTLYDPLGAVVGYRKIELAGGLGAGAAQDFSISAASLGGGVAHYLIAAEGRP
jgi:LysM repeat protein